MTAAEILIITSDASRHSQITSRYALQELAETRRQADGKLIAGMKRMVVKRCCSQRAASRTALSRSLFPAAFEERYINIYSLTIIDVDLYNIYSAIVPRYLILRAQ